MSHIAWGPGAVIKAVTLAAAGLCVAALICLRRMDLALRLPAVRS